MTTPTEDPSSSNADNSGAMEVNQGNPPPEVKEEALGPMEEGEEELQTSKRQRHRKRKMYATICKQLEFYFSDANILKNRLMQEKVLGAEYVDLQMFLDFNRIKKFTSKVEDLHKALFTSDKLVLSPDNKGVKRKVPFDLKNVKSEAEIEESTIYVENVPRHVDHEWLETIFQSFGPIAYISLPKFRSSHTPKGFAFVEFESPDSAACCLEAYKGEGDVLPSDMDPAALMSIQTFSEEQEALKVKKEQGDKVGSSTPQARRSSPRKRPHEENGQETPEETKKIKLESDSPGESPSKFTSPSEVESTSNHDMASNNGDEAEEPGKKKKKRKKNKAKKSAEDKLEGDSIHLKVMPKTAWRQLRNRYLNLQRQNMSKLKKQLREQYLREQHYKNCQADPGYAKSHVIEIDLDSPAESVEAFRKQIKVDLAGESEEEAAISGFIKFVDYEEGALQAYVRFGEDDCFTARIENFIENAEKVFRSARTLTVYEAKEYKDRVLVNLKQKRKEYPKTKVRGKDRLLKAASKSASHVRFDEPEEGDEAEEEKMDVVDSKTVKVKDEEEDESTNEPESTTA